MSPSVRIIGREKPVFVEEGSTLLDVIQAGGFSVSADCGGTGKCGRCRIRVVEGAAMVPASAEEASRIEKKEVESGLRLACLHQAAEGLVLEVVEEVYRQEVYKRLGIGIGNPLPVSPSFRFVPLQDSTVEDALVKAGLAGDVDWVSLLPDSRGSGFYSDENPLNSDSSGPAAVRQALKFDSGPVIALLHPPVSLFGIGIDLGTTTIAAYMCDFQTGDILGVETARNPQVSFGADVMSRIVASKNPKDARVLKNLACETISSCILNLCKRYEIPEKNLVEGVVVGNPTMIHLLLGAPAHGLGIAPYRPFFHMGLDLLARDFGFPLHPGAILHTLPLPSAFVGADTVAAWLWAERTIGEKDSPTLLLDLGTNGEMVLSANGRLWATSCATGPAFEGATLRSGMAGMPGAVEGIRFEDDKLILNVIGNSVDASIIPRGICGSGAMSVLATLLRKGIIRPDGKFDAASKCEYIRETEVGIEFVLYPPREKNGGSSGGEAVVLHQKDVRELQFAKGAVAAGIRFLCDAAGIDAPERILLAGAFGNVIKAEDALTIGLIPEISAASIVGIGNAAGLGACLALLDSRIRDRASSLFREIQAIELGSAPGFKEVFFANLSFPGTRKSNSADSELKVKGI
ncbi:MAG: ASKHA domain-containing protein [Syntrophobacteraceae bacterium]